MLSPTARSPCAGWIAMTEHQQFRALPVRTDERALPARDRILDTVRVPSTHGSRPGGELAEVERLSGHEQPPSWIDDLRARLDALLDEHRAMLLDSLDGLTEEEARRSLVPSRTTLLGLVKHVTYVENVWFNQALTGRDLKELGAPSTPDRSFILRTTDTIESVRSAYTDACAESRRLVADLALEQEVTGRGRRALWAIYTHMLRELAQHCGHADILREQVLAARD
jgi:hypothetical protein